MYWLLVFLASLVVLRVGDHRGAERMALLEPWLITKGTPVAARLSTSCLSQRRPPGSCPSMSKARMLPRTFLCSGSLTRTVRVASQPTHKVNCGGSVEKDRNHELYSAALAVGYGFAFKSKHGHIPAPVSYHAVLCNRRGSKSGGWVTSLAHNVALPE